MIDQLHEPVQEERWAGATRMIEKLSMSLVACLALGLLLPIAAVADQADQVNDLSGKANALIDENNARYENVSDLWRTVTAIDPASPDAAGVLPMLDEMAAALKEMSQKVTSIVALCDQAAALDVSPEIRTWFGKQKEVSVLRWHELSLMSDSTAMMQRLYGDWTRLGETERADLYERLETNYTERLDIVAVAEEKQAAADQYAQDEGLIDTSAGSDAWIDILVFSAIGLVGAAIGRSIRRRRRRQGGAELLKEGEATSWEE
jgi:hypothetical protein